MFKPSVSVIIPSYGRACKLIRSIQSVLDQSIASKIELIIVDDNGKGSPNQIRTEKSISKIDFSNLHSFTYLILEENNERSAARNRGIVISKGDYIMFLDNDDYYHPYKVEVQLKQMRKNPNYGVSYTAFNRVIESEIVGYLSDPKMGDCLLDCLSRNLFVHAGSNLMIERSVLLRSGYFNENISNNEDIELLCRILQITPILYVDYLGLTVDLGDDYYNVNEKDYFATLNDYKELVKPIVETLDIEARKTFFSQLELQTFKFLVSQKQFIRAFIIFKKIDITVYQKLKYIMYALKRKTTKKVFSFELEVRK